MDPLTSVPQILWSRGGKGDAIDPWGFETRLHKSHCQGFCQIMHHDDRGYDFFLEPSCVLVFIQPSFIVFLLATTWFLAGYEVSEDVADWKMFRALQDITKIFIDI